jgi:hypothetical protein
MLQFAGFHGVWRYFAVFRGIWRYLAVLYASKFREIRPTCAELIFSAWLPGVCKLLQS